MPRLPHTSKQAVVLFWTFLQNSSDWYHGYSLMQSTGMKSGTLYPLLIRLSDDDFLESRWDMGDESGKPRRLYRLTAAGKSLAHERLTRFSDREGTSANGAST